MTLFAYSDSSSIFLIDFTCSLYLVHNVCTQLAQYVLYGSPNMLEKTHTKSIRTLPNRYKKTNTQTKILGLEIQCLYNK
jgi:hypothetical protein